jgi:hypothetical protein
MDTAALLGEIEYLHSAVNAARAAANALYKSRDAETIRAQTRVLRRALDGLEDHADDAQTLLSGLEQEAGLVREDGSRVDE